MPERDTKEIKRITALLKNARARVVKNTEAVKDLKVKITEHKDMKVELVKDVKVFQDMMKIHAKERSGVKSEVQLAKETRESALKKVYKETINVGSYTSELKARTLRAKESKASSKALADALLAKRNQILKIQTDVKKIKAVKKELTADEKKTAAKEKKDALEKKIASFTPTELLDYQKKIKTTKDNAKKTANERKVKKNLKNKNDNILTQMGF